MHNTRSRRRAIDEGLLLRPMPTITITENTKYTKYNSVLLNTVSLSPYGSHPLKVPVRKLMEYVTV